MLHEEAHIIVGTDLGLWLAGRDTPIAFAEQPVGALALDGDTLYAVVARHDVWRASIGGDPAAWAWTRISGSAHELTTLLARGGVLWAGSEEAHLLRGEPEAGGALEAVESFETLDDRERWFTPWGGPPAVRSIAVADDGTVFVNVHVGGILRSPDTGESWTQTIDIRVDVHQVVLAGSPGTVLAPAGRGSARR